ncbi:MAG TPA: sodium:solute symporter [Candidatus Binatia bacterium]|jgi:SSS family solute:Na+ symporter|nr:sodium:solute symporter [Candidatus Binatia bacterium]
MNLLDFVVLLGSMVGIAAYGIWRTRGPHDLRRYLKGDETLGWAAIGISVMATQASAITFISTPGQGYHDGLGFVQNYFGMPLALIIVAAVFLPIYRRLNVYTAYEFLGRRFDAKTRLLGAALFLLQRGVNAGITIYAPAIILSTMLGWRLDATILLSGTLVILYTVIGGSQAVTLTHKYQMTVIFGGMVTALVVLVVKLPAALSFTDALAVAGSFKKLQAVDFSPDLHRRYTFWSGLLGGIFLMLSYFGADQSQVQRYLSGGSLRASRLGLMFNAVIKIPMQFIILLLGALLFVFYQFEQPPVFFNQAAWQAVAQHDPGLHALEQKFATVHAEKQHLIETWLAARHAGDRQTEAAAKAQAFDAHQRSEAVRIEARTALEAADSHAKAGDADYVFITFVLQHLPHGVIGLLIAAFFAAALSSKASELNALGSTTTVDFYRHVLKPGATQEHYVAASKWFTLFWGLVALGFALFANLADNLVQAANILGSLFYGVILGLFLVAFFLRRVGGSAVFWAGLAAEALVLVFHFTHLISYLWYNLIGCAACVLFSLLLQTLLGPNGLETGGESRHNLPNVPS